MNSIAGLMYGGDGDDRLSPRDQTRGIVAYGEDGDDIITDASQANDWIDGGAGADNSFDVQAAVRAAAVSNGFDTTITSGANTIFLPGVDINDMTSANFDFF